MGEEKYVWTGETKAEQYIQQVKGKREIQMRSGKKKKMKEVRYTQSKHYP